MAVAITEEVPAVKSVEDIRRSVRGEGSAELYDVVRLICSDDGEAAASIATMEEGGGYQDLRAAGLSVLEATRCIAAYRMLSSAMAAAEAEAVELTLSAEQTTADYLSFILSQIAGFEGGSTKLATAVEAAFNAITNTLDGAEEEIVSLIVRSKVVPPAPVAPVTAPAASTGGGMTQDEVTALIEMAQTQLEIVISGSISEDNQELTDIISAIVGGMVPDLIYTLIEEPGAIQTLLHNTINELSNAT